MLHTFHLYLKFASIQLRSQMQYRLAFWFEIFSTGFLSMSYVASILLVINRFGGISDWSVGEIAFLVGMVEMSFGMMDLLFSGFDPDIFSQYIQFGRLDQILLRPMSVAIQVLGSRVETRRLGRIVGGLGVFLLGIFLVDFQWTPGKILYLPLVFISQVIAFAALFVAGSTLIIWTIQRVEAINIFTYGGVELMSYPMSIYPMWIQKFFTYIIPYIFMNHYPALYFLDKPDPFQLPRFFSFFAPLAALIMLGAASAFWKFGLRHYQSTGT
jgi:ABC-2 type transport system permease protein